MPPEQGRRRIAGGPDAPDEGAPKPSAKDPFRAMFEGLDEDEPSTRPTGSLRGVMLEAEKEPPSVSFPSSPPDGSDEDDVFSVKDAEILSLTDASFPVSSAASSRRPALAFELPHRTGARARREDGRTSDPPADITPVLASLRLADSRDAIIGLALRGLELLARRVVVFAVRKEGFRGWSGSPELGDDAAIREIVVPHEESSILTIAAKKGAYLGPIPATLAHASLLRLMGLSSSHVSVVAARVARRPALLLLADELFDTASSPKKIEELAGAVGEALARALAPTKAP